MAGPGTISGLRPGAPIAGTFRPPGSKSIAQRALLAAAAAAGRTRLVGLPAGADVAACEELVRGLGARLERGAPGELDVHGTAGALAPRGALCAGESGTLARLASALVAWSTPGGAPVRIEATGSLLVRASAPLFAALAASGVGVRHLGRPQGWPVELVPLARAPRRAELAEPRSSQELSALLLASAAHEGEHELHVRGPLPSRPYVDLSSAVLRRFGARCVERAAPAAWIVQGPLRAPAEPLAVEPDASSAAVALAAACLSGGRVCVVGLGAGSAQGDVRIVEHLCAFGCVARAEDAQLVAEGPPTRAAELDLGGEPDLAPVLAVVAAAAADACGSASRLAGLATLRGKESDRIAVLARGLTLAGYAPRVEPDALVVGARAPSAQRPVVLDPAGDHRMAFAFALLGLLREGLRVRGSGCVAKSWPGFWDDLAGLGARLHEAP